RHEPVLARAVGRLERGWRSCKRNPVVASLIAGIVSVFVLAFLIVAWRWREAVHAREQAEAARREAAEKTDELERNLYSSLITQTDRELANNNPVQAALLLEDCSDKLRGWEWHYLRRRCSEQPVSLRGHVKGIWAVAFRPDGQQLVSGSIDGTA